MERCTRTMDETLQIRDATSGDCDTGSDLRPTFTATALRHTRASVGEEEEEKEYSGSGSGAGHSRDMGAVGGVERTRNSNAGSSRGARTARQREPMSPSLELPRAATPRSPQEVDFVRSMELGSAISSGGWTRLSRYVAAVPELPQPGQRAMVRLPDVGNRSSRRCRALGIVKQRSSAQRPKPEEQPSDSAETSVNDVDQELAHGLHNAFNGTKLRETLAQEPAEAVQPACVAKAKPTLTSTQAADKIPPVKRVRFRHPGDHPLPSVNERCQTLKTLTTEKVAKMDFMDLATTFYQDLGVDELMWEDIETSMDAQEPTEQAPQENETAARPRQLSLNMSALDEVNSHNSYNLWQSLNAESVDPKEYSLGRRAKWKEMASTLPKASPQEPPKTQVEEKRQNRERHQQLARIQNGISALSSQRSELRELRKAFHAAVLRELAAGQSNG